MAEKKTIELEVKSNVGESISDLKALKRQLKDTAAGSEEFKKIYNQIDDLEDKIKSSKKASLDWIDTLESADGPLGMVGASLNKAKVATQSFGGALKATGIGLFVSLIGGLVAAFQDNENAMKKLQPLLDGVGKLFNGVFRAVEPLFNTLVDLAIGALPTVSKAFGVVYSSVTAVFQSLGMLGGAIKKLISGDFSGAWQNAKSSVNDFSKNYDASIKRFNNGTKELTKTEKEESEKRAENRRKAEEKRIAEQEKAKEKALADRKAELDKINALEEGFTLKAVDTEKIKSDNANLAMQKDLTNKVAIGQGTASYLKYIADEEIANAEAVLNAKKVIAQANFDLVNKGVNLLAGLAGKNKALQKAAIIAQAGIGIFSVIKDTQAANAAAIAPPPIGIGPLLGPGLQIRNTIGGALSIASITAASAKALAAVGGGGSVSGGSIGSSGGGGGAPAAPSFNVVGASATNQLAQTIGNQQQQPIKAYVVSNDVTTAQSLDRNIIQSASIG